MAKSFPICFLLPLLLLQEGLALSLLPPPALSTYDSWRSGNHCYLLEGSSLRLNLAHVDKASPASSLQECERECDLAFFNCKSFSYSNSDANLFLDNCLLSTDDSFALDLLAFKDFEKDTDFNYYQRAVGDFCKKKEGGNLPKDFGIILEEVPGTYKGNNEMGLRARERRWVDDKNLGRIDVDFVIARC